MKNQWQQIWEWLNDYSGALTLVLASVAALWAIKQLRTTQKIRKHEFEDIYVQRYWAVFDGLTSGQKLALWNPEANQEVLRAPEVQTVLWKYMELCEDQADLRAVGLITKQTWKQWESGVRSAACAPPYVDMLDALLSDLQNSRPGCPPPFIRLREARTAQKRYDPRSRYLRQTPLRLLRGWKR
ncbi:hypothetical protein GCM10009805_07590 [Leucobacter chromiireducens subsp. solipictus]